MKPYIWMVREGVLGDEMWYTRVGFCFKLFSCIGFSSQNKEQVSLCGRRFNSGVKSNHVKYCVSFILHACDLFVIKSLNT